MFVFLTFYEIIIFSIFHFLKSINDFSLENVNGFEDYSKRFMMGSVAHTRDFSVRKPGIRGCGKDGEMPCFVLPTDEELDRVLAFIHYYNKDPFSKFEKWGLWITNPLRSGITAPPLTSKAGSLIEKNFLNSFILFHVFL